MTPPTPPPPDPSSVPESFSEARAQFEALLQRLSDTQAHTMTHSDVEDLLWRDGLELLRRMYQGHLDLRAETEEAEAVMGADGVLRTHVRPTHRKLETRFGTVAVHRQSVGQREVGAVFPMDAALNLPPEQYSFPLQRQVAEEVARGSFAEASRAVSETTAAAVGKLQVEQIAARAAEDFEAFYAARRLAGEEETDALLVLTFDAKGIVMRKEDLRPATQKAAETEAHKLEKRLSKGEKRNRKRIASVAAVYSVAPWPRTAADIVRDLHAAPSQAGSRPKPAHKTVWASVEKDVDEVIRLAFEEAERRDPGHRRRWVVLLDGNKTQIALAQKEARKRGISLTLVLDLIHVLEYLWGAAWCFHAEGDRQAEAWVSARLEKILAGKSADVAAGIRRAATARGLEPAARKNADKCAGYLLHYRALLGYDAYLQDGLPIATGVIEGACRYLVQDRMDITGARWSLQGAEAVLRLRALHANGDLADYWAFHQQQERLRNHVPPYHPSELHRITGLEGCTPGERKP